MLTYSYIPFISKGYSETDTKDGKPKTNSCQEYINHRQADRHCHHFFIGHSIDWNSIYSLIENFSV